MIDTQFLLRVLVAAFATVGFEEFIKNFFKPRKKVWYAVLMLPIATGCYMVVELLPLWVIGSVLTVGSVQLGYQTLVQGVDVIIKNISKKLGDSNIVITEGQ